jgi:hypothetical protein
MSHAAGDMPDELPELLQLAVRLRALLAPQAALHQSEDA